MIKLNRKYTGEISENGKANSITLHDVTFTICSPDYKRGNEISVAYSDVKHIFASKETLVLKIMRTEVVLSGFSAEERRDLVRLIEVGRREPIGGSKEYRKYQKDSEREEQKRERKELKEEQRRERKELKEEQRRDRKELKREANAARIAAIADCVDRFTVERAKNRQLEAERKYEEKKRLLQAEEHISDLPICYDDDVDAIGKKIFECATLFKRYCNHSDEDYATLSDKVYEVLKENVAFLEENYPSESITERAKAQLKKIDDDKKKEGYKNIVVLIFLIVILGGYILSDYLGLDLIKLLNFDFLKSLK